MKNHFKYWIFVLTFCYGLTIGAQYLFRPFWFIKSVDHTNLAETELLFTIFLLPIFLVAGVYWATKKLNKRNWFILSSIIICSCIYISARLGFLNWADSVGNRTRPDSETLMVVALELQGGLVVATVGLIICCVRLYLKKKAPLN